MSVFLKNWDSLHARLNSQYEAWSYKKKKEYERSTLQESCLEITYRKNVSVISRHEAI